MDVIGHSFLTSTVWRKKREKILRRDGYTCQLSKRYGKNVPADAVHHIFPREEFPEYALADWNLISVSTAMHRTLEGEAGLTPDGAALLRRTAVKNNIPIPDNYK